MSEPQEEKPALDPDALPARADRDYFPSLGEKIGDADRSCLGCLAGIAVLVLTALIWALVWYLRTPEVQQRH